MNGELAIAKPVFLKGMPVFFNAPIYVAPSPSHSATEERYYTLGKTDAGRLLFVVFTRRGNKVRIISARDMHRKERRVYDEKAKRDTKV